MKELEMTGLLLKLADLGVTGIKVHYDGGGDSGAVEDIVYTTEPCEDFDDIDDKTNSWDGHYDLASLDKEACDLVNVFVTNELLQNIEDWWNNEGGWGEVLIEVPSGKYEINNHIRIVNSESYKHGGSLTEKSAR